MFMYSKDARYENVINLHNVLLGFLMHEVSWVIILEESTQSSTCTPFNTIVTSHKLYNISAQVEQGNSKSTKNDNAIRY